MAENKMDLAKYREVLNQQTLNKAKTLGIPIMETSALDSTNIKETFYDLIKEIYKDMNNTIKSEHNNNLKPKKKV